MLIGDILTRVVGPHLDTTSEGVPVPASELWKPMSQGRRSAVNVQRVGTGTRDRMALHRLPVSHRLLGNTFLTDCLQNPRQELE